MLLTLLAGLAQPAPYATPPALLSGAITSEDYPALALAEDARGLAKVRVVIGTDGRIGACQIALSTGNILLDQASCAIPRERFMFEPARDAEGKPVPATAILPVRWEIQAHERDTE